jgi:hypothetical protein
VIDTEEVERRVRATVKALSDIPTPEHRSRVQERRVAARFQLHGRTGLVNVLVATCVVAVVVLALIFGPFVSGGPRSSSKGRSAHPARSTLIPRNWRTYAYGKAAISVPRNWSIDTCPAPSAAGTLDLGPLKMACKDVDSSTATTVTLTATTASLRQIERSGGYCIVKVNGLTIGISPCTSSNPSGIIVWTVPSLGIAASAFQKGSGSVGFLTVSLVNRVLRTLRRRTT